MAFKVCTVGSVSGLDSLPVAKIVEYPLERRDYKPYAQNNLCLFQGRLLLRMWAFELTPAPSSQVQGVFYLFDEQPETALCVTASAAGELVVQLVRDGVFEAPLALPGDARTRPHAGEDLQGVYWGRVVELPLDWLGTLAGPVTLSPGTTFAGNFFKLCEQVGSAHKGCFYPADFRGNLYGRASMGEFEVVAY